MAVQTPQIGILLLGEGGEGLDVRRRAACACHSSSLHVCLTRRSRDEVLINVHVREESSVNGIENLKRDF